MTQPVSLLATLLFLGVALLPVYIFDSGAAQPTHIALALFAGGVWLVSRVALDRWSMLLLLLAVYGTLVELIYFAAGADPETLLNAAYLIYNFIIPYAVFAYCARRSDGAVARGLVIATAIAIVTVILNGVKLQAIGTMMRETGSFNNPNQLGYFAVCLLSLTYLLRLRGAYRNSMTIALYAAAIFLAIASLSKAAMVAMIGVLFFASKPRLSRNFVALWVFAVVGAAGLLLVAYQSGYLDRYLFMQRLDGLLSEGDSSLADRGYFVFLKGDILQVFLGLGSGNVDRLLGHEVHSTFFAILSNYGLVGFALLVAVILIWFKSLWRTYGLVGLICIAGPSMLYGLTHNGSRFTIFWILFALSLVPLPAAQRRALKNPGSRPLALEPERPPAVATVSCSTSHSRLVSGRPG